MNNLMADQNTPLSPDILEPKTFNRPVPDYDQLCFRLLI